MAGLFIDARAVASLFSHDGQTLTTTHSKEDDMADPPDYPGAPRWVKIAGAVAVGSALLVALIFFTGVGGSHGPGRQMPSAESGNDLSPEGR